MESRRGRDPTGSARRSKRVSGRRRRGRSPTGSNERSDRDGHVRANCTRQACMLRQRASLSLPLFSPYVPFRTYVRMQTYIYIYTFTNTRMADAPRPRYATSSSLSLSDRLNPRPAFLFKPRAFGYGTGFESFVGSTVAASTVFARRNYSTNFLHFQSREY